MSIFVSKEKVPVTIDGVNVVYIRSKMSLGVRNKVQDALLSVGTINGTQAEDVSVQLGKQQSVLLSHNIVAWEGPLFRDDVTQQMMPCIPENILELDPDDPLVEKVLQTISDRNTKKDIVPKEESLIKQPTLDGLDS